MAVVPADMANEIVAKLPEAWRSQWVDGSPPKEWIQKYVLDVTTIWTTLTMTAGLGPPPAAIPPDVYLHSHDPLVVTASATNMATLTSYTGNAKTVFGIVSSELADHITASFATASAAGTVLHDHVIEGLAGTGGTLKTSIITALTTENLIGTTMPDQPLPNNSLDLVFGAIAEGTIDHLASNGELATAGPLAAHVHAVS